MSKSAARKIRVFAALQARLERYEARWHASNAILSNGRIAYLQSMARARKSASRAFQELDRELRREKTVKNRYQMRIYT